MCDGAIVVNGGPGHLDSGGLALVEGQCRYAGDTRGIKCHCVRELTSVGRLVKEVVRISESIHG